VVVIDELDKIMRVMDKVEVDDGFAGFANDTTVEGQPIKSSS
jgi:hypothetical protein